MSDSPILVRAVTETPILGRLSLKSEPAGKVRVFAILDGFTQSALKPLHDWIFSILKTIPSDATFDQEGQTSRFAVEHRSKDIFSFDLSAATDLIPFELTRLIMEEPLGRITPQWASLLVDRDFLTPEGKKIRYTRGQPIGALSSWAALALTHHWLVQESARRVGVFPFLDYLVLGDDISIAGKVVADSYLEVCKDYGVPINNKGITSFASPERDSLVNFANQIIVGEINYSPIQIREEVAVSSLSARAESLARLIRKGVIDYNSPKFLSTTFRHSVVSSRQIEIGRKSFSQGLLPVGFSEILTMLLLPGPSKGWIKTGDSPLTYVYTRLLAGLDIVGGWNYYSSHPDKLVEKTLIRGKVLPALLELAQEIWAPLEAVIIDQSSFINHIRGKEEFNWRESVLQSLKSDSGRVGARHASYALALDTVEAYFASLMPKDPTKPFAGTKMGELIDIHHTLINFLRDDKEMINYGELIVLFYGFLKALDEVSPRPQFHTSRGTVDRTSSMILESYPSLLDDPSNKELFFNYEGTSYRDGESDYDPIRAFNYGPELHLLPHHREFASEKLNSGGLDILDVNQACRVQEGLLPSETFSVPWITSPAGLPRMDVLTETILQKRRLFETPRSIRLVRKLLRNPAITKLFA
jgi:hypothetical protein